MFFRCVERKSNFLENKMINFNKVAYFIHMTEDGTEVQSLHGHEGSPKG